MIKIGKPYNVSQLRQMFGENYGKPRQVIRAIPIKPVIRHVDEFDARTKEIYKIIYDEVMRVNRGAPHSKVYATGSRVTGTWKTKEEAEQFAEDTGKPVKYSDYDYWTDAPVRPSITRLNDLTGEKIDCVRSSVLVLINPKQLAPQPKPEPEPEPQPEPQPELGSGEGQDGT